MGASLHDDARRFHAAEVRSKDFRSRDEPVSLCGISHRIYCVVVGVLVAEIQTDRDLSESRGKILHGQSFLSGRKARVKSAGHLSALRGIGLLISF